MPRLLARIVGVPLRAGAARAARRTPSAAIKQARQKPCRVSRTAAKAAPVRPAEGTPSLQPEPVPRIATCRPCQLFRPGPRSIRGGATTDPPPVRKTCAGGVRPLLEATSSRTSGPLRVGETAVQRPPVPAPPQEAEVTQLSADLGALGVRPTFAVKGTAATVATLPEAA